MHHVSPQPSFSGLMTHSLGLTPIFFHGLLGSKGGKCLTDFLSEKVVEHKPFCGIMKSDCLMFAS